MTDIGYFDLDGITLRQEPARDACFTIDTYGEFCAP